MRFKVTTCRKPRYVEYNDWNGSYVVPGYMILRSVEPVPVTELPGAELRQYGHEAAFVSIRVPPKFLDPLGKGDFVELPEKWLVFSRRNGPDRKRGLCRARISVRAVRGET